MMKRKRRPRDPHSSSSAGRALRGLVALGAASLLLGPPTSREAGASDHVDAPNTQADARLDIGDFYAWPTGRGTLVAIVTFNAGLEPIAPDSPPPPYDRDAIYTIHIDNTATAAENDDFFDNDNDNEADIQIHARFGQDVSGNWGVQFLDVPGADGPIVGPVQTPLESGSATVMAGIFDDPFFFDFEGFTATLMNLLDDSDPADLAFSLITAGKTADTFAGSNALAIVVEIDLDQALDGNGDDFLQMWATSGVRP